MTNLEQGSVMAFSSAVKLAALKRSDGRCECVRPAHPHSGRCTVRLTLDTARFHYIDAWARHARNGLGNCEVLCARCDPSEAG